MKFNYNIYMLPDGHPKAFWGTLFLKNETFATKEEYKLTYSGYIDLEVDEISRDSTLYILDKIFEQLNLYRPEDYKCHSLSVSDVVELNGVYYFCDSMGWKELDWR